MTAQIAVHDSGFRSVSKIRSAKGESGPAHVAAAAAARALMAAALAQDLRYQSRFVTARREWTTQF